MTVNVSEPGQPGKTAGERAGLTGRDDADLPGGAPPTDDRLSAALAEIEALRSERDHLAGCLRASSANESKYIEDSVTLAQLRHWLPRLAQGWRTGSTVLERDRKIRQSCADDLDSLIEQIIPAAPPPGAETSNG